MGFLRLLFLVSLVACVVWLYYLGWMTRESE